VGGWYDTYQWQECKEDERDALLLLWALEFRVVVLFDDRIIQGTDCLLSSCERESERERERERERE